MNKFNITKDALSLFTAAFIVDFIITLLARYFWGKSINDWYDNFGICAVFADVFSIVIGIVLAYIIFIEVKDVVKNIFKVEQESELFDALLFIGIAIIVQFLHDIFFYYAVIKPIPLGHNKMIDVFKDYSDSVGVGILFVDAAMIISTIIIFYIISNYFNDVYKLLSFAIIMYAFQYVIYTPRQIRQ
jgi:hypothetical protein